MKKIKKYILIVSMIIITVAIVFGQSNTALASPDGTWQPSKATVTLGSYINSGASGWMSKYWNTYCLQQGQSLVDCACPNKNSADHLNGNHVWMKHNVKSKVEIRGKTAKLYNSSGTLVGTSVNDRHNVLAAILTPNDMIPSSVLQHSSRKNSDWWSIGMYVSSSAASHPSKTLADYSRAQLALWWELDLFEDSFSADGISLGWGYSQPSGIKTAGGDAEGGAGFSYDLSLYGTFCVDLYYLESSTYQNLLVVEPYQAYEGEEKPESVFDLYVGKEWGYDSADVRPSAIKITLLADNKEVTEDNDGNPIKPIILDSSYSMFEYYGYDTDDGYSDYWEHAFENLPLEDEYGNTIKYTLKESVVNSEEQEQFDVYTPYDEWYSEDCYIFSNWLETNITVKKEWVDNNNKEGKRPTSVTVQLYENGKKYVNEDATTVVTLSDSNNWTGQFEYLPQYINGKKAVYTVKEIAVDGYTSSVSGDETSGFVITNTYIQEAEPETTQVTVTKKWDDNSNSYGKRPGTITINLLANGNQCDIAQVTGTTDTWTYTFTDLPTEKDGNKITYTIKEDSVDGYTSSVSGDETSGFVITNTYIPETTQVTVTKKWEDEGYKEQRPSSITVRLMANGTQQVAMTTLSETNDWTHTFTNLNKYEAGKEIKYTLEEDPVDKYTTKIEGDQNKGYVITNTINLEIIEIEGIVWLDGAAGKPNDINGIYVDKLINSNSPDKGFNDVKVKLIDNKENTIKETVPEENGRYLIRVENVDLTGAYVEFEYDGILYTTVQPNKETTYRDNAGVVKNATSDQQSKAIENRYTRSTLDGNNSNVTATTKHPYEIEWKDKCIKASTKDIISFNEGYITKISKKDGKQVKALENVNLGLFEREQPNVALFSDISKVEVEMNNQRYTYLYGVRSNRYNPEDANYIQAKFQNKDTYIYKRPVNPADIAYIRDGHSGAMEVYVTYAITIGNLSNTLTITVDSIANDYDSNYLIKYGDGDDSTERYHITYGKMDDEGKITGTPINASQISEPDVKDGYSEVILSGLGIKVTAEQGESENKVYIRYRINQDILSSLFADEPPLNNASEIFSYSTTYGATTLYAEQKPYEGNVSEKQNQPYGGYDYDSHPGNANIKLKKGSDEVQRLYSTDINGNIISPNEMEDDTDIAPSFVLCKGDELKTLSGTVWEDTDVILDDDERKGSGSIDIDKATGEYEKGAENVKVEIYAADGSAAKLYKSANHNDIASTVTYTNEEGKYSFPGVVTGEKYKVKFTYGNYDEEEKEENEANGKVDISENFKDDPLGSPTKINENEVNARNYKSTIITDEIVRKVIEGVNNDNWLLEHKDNFSVAIDDIEDRLSIPELKNGNFYDGINMTAYTKPFVIQLEFDETDETSNVKTDPLNVENNVVSGKIKDAENQLDKLDFGIIERPREDLVVQKTITDFSITLANGQLLTKGDPRDREKNMPYVKTMGFVEATNITEARLALEKQLLVEMDTELIQGAKMDVTYEVKVINNNEIDYDYEQTYGKEYYYYGTVPTGKTPLPSTIQFVDYMNRELNFNTEENEDWNLITEIEANLKNNGYISGDALAAINKYGYKVLQTEGETAGSKKITINWDDYTFAEIKTTKMLASKEENVYDNNVEIIEIDGKTARTVKGKDENGIQLEYVPGNYEPGELPEEGEPESGEPDDDKVNIIITPPTGITNYIITYLLTALTGLITVFVGILFIKKKVLIK